MQPPARRLRQLLLAAALVAVPSCAPKLGPVVLLSPNPAYLKRDDKPVAPPTIATDEDAQIKYDNDIHDWGQRRDNAVGEVCRWFQTQGVKGLDCQPAPQ